MAVEIINGHLAVRDDLDRVGNARLRKSALEQEDIISIVFHLEDAGNTHYY
jgi:hypothetical protein